MRPATSIPTSAITPPNPIISPSARVGVGRSSGSKRNASTAPINGTAAITIAASDEDTCSSPAAISGNGIDTSATAYAISHRHRPLSVCSVPARHASPMSTIAASVTRAHASIGGVIPPLTAIRMNR